MVKGRRLPLELGDGTRTDRLKPVDVSGLSSGVAAVSAGFDQTCALLNSGGVKCWGQNATGEVGDGSTKLRRTPVTVAGLSSGVASISAGYNHTCAVTTGGGALCWGNNKSGELGDRLTRNWDSLAVG
jgi:alpha-tubulin suppressor-like RCC1 family protein